MKTQFYQKKNIFKLHYHDNRVVHLIILCILGYVVLQALNLIMMIALGEHQSLYESFILPNVGMQGFSQYIHKPWVLLTYFWTHPSFLYMLSNMLWLYCFGSVIQSFVGYREIFPLFILSSVTSALGFLITTALFPNLASGPMITVLPGVMGFAVGAIVLVPHHRFYITENLAIHIWVVLAIFIILNVLTVINDAGLIVIASWAAISGAIYIWLLRRGYSAGAYFEKLGNSVQGEFSPKTLGSTNNSLKRNQAVKASKHQIQENPTQEYVDLLLDKISQKGYKSLTPEEKQTLINAGRNKR